MVSGMLSVLMQLLFWSEVMDLALDELTEGNGNSVHIPRGITVFDEFIDPYGVPYLFLWRRQKERRDVHCAMPDQSEVQRSCNVWRIRDTLQWICPSRSPLQPSDDLILDLVVGSLRNDLARNQLRLVRVGPAVDDPFRVGVPNAGQ